VTAAVGRNLWYWREFVPAMFFNVGIAPPDVDVSAAAPNHSPRFRIDETGLLLGLRSIVHLRSII
jgi:metal-dependent amidase/aminoacylase/carboxypeptidase family protein